LQDFIGCLIRVDPVQRYSATQALEHPWLATGAKRVVSAKMLTTGVEYKKWLARKRLKGAMGATTAVIRLQNMLGGGHKSSDGSDTERDRSGSEIQHNAAENDPIHMSDITTQM
jgi:hypothetical protein